MSTEVTRRQALVVAGLGAATTVVGGAGTWRTLVGDGSGSATGAPVTEPTVLASSGGTLDVTLRAAPGARLDGRSTQALGYNGTSPGPTLVVRPGDRLRLRLENDLVDTTNLHTHGLHVSPEGTSDNVFRTVEPGTAADYEYRIPDDHPAGTFWYHPHHHGTVADQVFGGLHGALLVVGADEPVVERERVLVVSDTRLTPAGEVAGVTHAEQMRGREGELVLVNGLRRPELELAAGTTERWRVVNACVSRFLDLRLDGHTWGLLGLDGQALHDPVDREGVLLAPGNRADLLVRPTGGGTTSLRTHSRDRGGMGMMGGGGVTSPEVELATVIVRDPGTPATTRAWSSPWPVAPDLRAATVERRRVLTMTGGMGMGMGGREFGFDGRTFDPARTDQRLALGSVEEWTIGNATMMDHPFHLHVWPMQVLEAPEHDPDGPADWRDVVVVPAMGQVTVRVPVRDFGGRTVYHCHVLDHEDLGMMGVVEAG